MSQNDFSIANQTASNFRADLNSALQALASLSSGSTAPTTTYANMFWYDTGTNILKIRSEADDAWINFGYLDQTANAFRILDDTQVTNTSGTQTGLLGDQATATWETGTSTTESLVSPAKVKAAIDALVPAQDPSLGEGQSWATASRTAGVSYQNTSGRPIQISVRVSRTTTGGPEPVTTTGSVEVSTDGSTWVTVALPVVDGDIMCNVVIPNNHYYRYTNGTFLAILS